MLTSQQVEMQEKLQSLITKYEMLIGNVPTRKHTDGQNYFNYIINIYLGNERYTKAKFQKLTNLRKDTYYMLCGERKGGPIREITLASVAFGLGTTYQEAVLLFYYYGKNLFCDFPYLQKMNEVLRHLDTLEVKKADPETRICIMSKLMKEEGL